DVDTIIKDLVEIGIQHTKDKLRKVYQKKANDIAEEKIMEITCGKKSTNATEEYREMLRNGELDDREIEIEIPEKKSKMNDNLSVEIFQSLQEVSSFFPAPTHKIKMKIKDAKEKLADLELEKLLQGENVIKVALKHVEQDGIVFIDEIDKICSTHKD